MEPADPINPQRIFWELSPQLPDDVIICGDCGSHTNWYARDVKMRKGMPIRKSVAERLLKRFEMDL